MALWLNVHRHSQHLFTLISYVKFLNPHFNKNKNTNFENSFHLVCFKHIKLLYYPFLPVLVYSKLKKCWVLPQARTAEVRRWNLRFIATIFKHYASPAMQTNMVWYIQRIKERWWDKQKFALENPAHPKSWCRCFVLCSNTTSMKLAQMQWLCWW